MHHLGKMFKFEQVYSAGHTPIAQADVERLNQTIVNQLRSVVQDQSSQWPLFLQSTIFAYNSVPIGSTGVSPFALVFGRLPRFPHQIQFDEVTREFNTRSETIGSILKTQKAMYDTLQKFHTKNAQRKLEQANKGRKESNVIPGSVVFIKYPPSAVPEKGRQRLKLVPTYKGPFVCVSRLPNNTVTLKDLLTNEYLELPIHLSRIKTFANFNPQLYFANVKCLKAPRE
jgi:hypothetical protein